MGAAKFQVSLKLNKCFSILLSLTTFLGATTTALTLAGVSNLNACPALARSASTGETLSQRQKAQLATLEKEGLQYFLDNQAESGLIYDRQANFGPPEKDGQCSLSATGMGLIAIALASGPDHKMISREDAIARVKKALIATKSLPAIHGMMPHFFDPVTLKWKGSDQVSTIDSSWLIAGGLWAAAYLKDDELSQMANELYDRVDWNFWSKKDSTVGDGTETSTTGGAGTPVLGMGMDEKGKFWKANWDRINSEAAFMYILAIGARENALPASAWAALKPYNKKVAGEDLAGGDLGLFSFQYSNELTDLKAYRGNKIDLYAQSEKAAKANHDYCAANAAKFKTFQHLWGLSAGDGPPNSPEAKDAYRAYAPDTDVDGTAHVMATLASIDVAPDLVLENIAEADKLQADKTHPLKVHGRYGFSNINLDRNWVSKDVVGIDVGVAVMALENKLHTDAVRRVWQDLPSAKRAEAQLSTLQK